MTRSIFTGLLAVISVVALAGLPLACQSGGLGDPCTPEDEYDPAFPGFKVTQENIESRSFQCSTRICLVNHFQGRVSCPLGQDGVATPGSTRKNCDPSNPSVCAKGEVCTAAVTFAPDCDPAVAGGCPPGTMCDAKRKVCLCTISTDTQTCGPDHILRTYVCHKPNNCQSGSLDNSGNAGKDCCIPGTDTPVVAPVCGQCETKSNRDAAGAVYCSCRCGVAEGQVADPNFNFCQCPSGFSCTEIRKNVGLGDAQITGKYCIKCAGGAAKCDPPPGVSDPKTPGYPANSTVYTGSAQSCGTLGKGAHFDPTCAGVQSNN